MKSLDEVEFFHMIQNQIDHGNGSYGFTIDRNLFWAWNSSNTKIMEVFKMLDEDFIQMPLFIYINPRAIIFENMNEFIYQCHQHGFCQHFQSITIKSEHKKLEKKQAPQVLTMGKLSAGFLVWIGSVLVACIIFLCEHVVFWWQKRILSSKQLKLNPRTKPIYKI